MTIEESRLVQATHLGRRAYLYIRQSTQRQVLENKESTRRQYALKQRVEALGWPAEQIEVVDSDQGVSATSTAGREGFQRMVAEVSMGRVGIVIGLEVSRLARNCSDWHRLVELCAVTETLILDQDGLYDPTTFNHQILLGIKGFLSAVEIGVLRARLREALLGKAARAELRIGLPVGFVYDDQGHVKRHPDVQVQQSIELLFETFRRTGTAGATVKHFNDSGLLFPGSAGCGSRTKEVLWKPLALQNVVRILHNPRYAGAFAYGRRRTQKLPGGRSRIQTLPREQWHALVLDVHEGYISWDDFEHNEQQLRRSALACGLDKRRTAPRQGPALLQGLVVCGVCGARMTVRYHERAGALVPDYQCITGRMHARRPVCQSIGGAIIDQTVADKLVAAMTPQAIELTLAVRAELQTRLDEADKLRALQVERVAQDAELARRRFMQVDPDNRLVATTLEADWNDKLRQLARARDDAMRQADVDRRRFDATTEQRVRALAKDFPTLWNDPSTSYRDRKRMAQLLLEDVTLLKTDKLHVHIRWRGGATESLELPLPQSAWRRRQTHPDVVSRIEELLEHYDEHEVAGLLNREGIRTGAQKPFDVYAVRWVCYSHGLKTPMERRSANTFTIREMATKLGLTDYQVRAMARDGRLEAERVGRKPRWLVAAVDDQPEEIRALADRHARLQPAAPTPLPTSPALLERIDELLLDGYDDAGIAAQLNTEDDEAEHAPFDARAIRRLRLRCGLETLHTRLREGGMLTTAEIAPRLGIGLKTALNWARAGRLHGHLCGRGSSPRWLFDPIDQQPEPIRHRVAKRANVPRRRDLLSDAATGQGAS